MPGKLSLMSKRTVLAGMAAAGIAARLDAHAGHKTEKRFFAAHGLQIGLQLYPLRNELRADFAGTLRKVAAIGYRDIETSSLYGQTAAQCRAAFDAAGLTCRAMHVMPQAIGPGANLSANFDQVVADAHTMGATDVVMPVFLVPDQLLANPKPGQGNPFVIGGQALTADDYARMADFLNDKGDKLRREGLQLSYHNHNVEFAPLGDSYGLQILLRRTDPRLVQFELDVGWAYAAGVDVFALLEAHRGRITKFHVKDIQPTTPRNFAIQQEPADLGKGVIDWPRLLPAAYAAGTRGFYVEQEDPFTRPPIDVMADNYRYLENLTMPG